MRVGEKDELFNSAFSYLPQPINATIMTSTKKIELNFFIDFSYSTLFKAKTDCALLNNPFINIFSLSPAE